MKQSLMQSPPLEIEATTTGSSRIPSFLVTTMSSKRDLRTPSLGPRPFTKNGLIG
jgi:hypothetical protein